MGLNIVHLVGRVGSKDLKMFNSGTELVAYCTLTLAVRRPTRNSDEPDWFNLDIRGKTGEIAGNYVHKGSLIGVQGYLKIETWNDRTTGAKRSRPVIKVTKLDLLGSKRDNDPSAASNYGDGEF